MIATKTGDPVADVIASERSLMTAAMFILSRRDHVPTFAYQLAMNDTVAFATIGDAKRALEELSRLGVVAKRYVNKMVASQIPVAARGDTEGYYMTDEGLRAIRIAYRAVRPEVLRTN